MGWGGVPGFEMRSNDNHVELHHEAGLAGMG